MRKLLLSTLLSRMMGLTVVGILANGCTSQPLPASKVYVTEYGLGPDKWATAWLLTKHGATPARLQVVEPGTALAGGIAFDVRDSPIRRMQSRSAFEVAADTITERDDTLDRLAAIVHEIEVNYWSTEGPAESVLVENAYRELQQRYGRDRVSPECYVAFFDRVYNVLHDMRQRNIAFDAERLRMDCNELVQIAQLANELVPEVPIIDLLSAMATGQRVVFVDVREPDEYAEGHIPGALNIPLREVSKQLAARLQGADYVVSYCVKDFRGFEMAKALADVGVKHSVIMRPYGIKGWAAMKLPVAGTHTISEEQARADLDRCLAAGECLQPRSAT